METPVFAGVFIFFAAPRVSGARHRPDPMIESPRLGAVFQVHTSPPPANRFFRLGFDIPSNLPQTWPQPKSRVWQTHLKTDQTPVPENHILSLLGFGTVPNDGDGTQVGQQV